MVMRTDPVTPLEEDTSQALFLSLSLLGAAPIYILDNHDLIWPQPELGKALLRRHKPDLPDTIGDWSTRLSADGKFARNRALRGLTWDGAQYAVTYKVRTDDSREIWVEERGERLSGVERKPTEISAVLRDVQKDKEAQLRAGYSAHHDELTGMWNQDRLREELDQHIALAEHYGPKAVFLRLRVSNLPDINTTYGYEAGDRLLKAIAARLSEMTRAPDCAARISGINFGLIAYAASEGDIAALTTGLNEALSGTAYPSPYGALNAEFDMAVTRLGEQAGSACEAIAQTRAALNVIQNTTDKIIHYAADITVPKTQPASNETSADDILMALNDRRISLAFQPIIDAQTRQLHHYECLLRLRTDEGEVISAGKFIMASERLGLVHMLDRRALELAGETLRQYPDIHIALNVSAGTVKDIQTAEAYIAALKALGPDVKRVALELTETVALEDPAMASRFSVQTRALGCEFAIDDFGSGYTTFQNLMAIEADTIKIDGTFIQGLSLDVSKQTFVRMMVDLAQTFSVKTVAEMVETRADADLLKRLGVDFLQGYMFGIPSAAPAWRKEVS